MRYEKIAVFDCLNEYDPFYSPTPTPRHFDTYDDGNGYDDAADEYDDLPRVRLTAIDYDYDLRVSLPRLLLI